MAQYALNDFSLVTDDGNTLVADLNAWYPALHSMHLGSSDPSYAVQGMMYPNSTSADLLYNVRGASAFSPAFQLDDTNGIVRVALDADLDTYISAATDDEIMFRTGGTNRLKVTDNGIVFVTDAVRNSTRSEMGVAATILNKSSSYTAVAGDRGKIIRGTADFTLSLTAAATLGSDWNVYVLGDGGDVTIDPNGSETVDGSTTLVVSDGESVQVICDGTSFYALRGKESENVSGSTVWAKYRQRTSTAIDGSFNVSSLTDDGTGLADLSLTNALASTTDVGGGGASRQADTSGAPGSVNAILSIAIRPETTGRLNCVSATGATTAVDADLNVIAVNGSLA